MPNALHTMLSAANAQAQAVIGTLFDFGTQTGISGAFTAVDAKLEFELTGLMSECDLVAVVDLSRFDSGNEPTENAPLLFDGVTYLIRTLKTDQSAYVLGLKKISK
ncbi:MAG: hypothetical protein JSR30_00085 [Proteobacteria bacterium]|nr:hypothetical protein [Pseudomonadota bacterium]